MSISITIRPSGTTSGGTDRTIEGEGEIDTREEAEAALTFLPDGSEDTVVVGKDSYTRDRLIGIRDGVPSPDAEESETVRGEGVSHGAYLQGSGSGGFDDDAHKGHAGGRVRGGYEASLPLNDGDYKASADLRVGIEVGNSGTEYETPGGETASSSFTYVGPSLGAAVRLATPWLLSGSIGFVAAVGGFLSEEGTEVSTPGNCEPGDFGRGECEPSAGARKGNAGTSGAYNPRTGNSRETDGAYVSVGIPVTIGFDILRGDFGSIALNAILEPGYTALLPSDGDGTGYWNLSGGGEVVARFGGAESHVAKEEETEDKDGDGVRDNVDSCPDDAGPGTPDGCPESGDKDGDGVSDDKDKCADTAKGAKVNELGCPIFEASITSFPDSVKPEGKLAIGLKVSSLTEVSVVFKDASGKSTNAKPIRVPDGESTSEFDVPATLPAGKYTVLISFADSIWGDVKTEEREITIVERVSATLPGSFAPGQPPAVQDVKVAGQPKLEGVSYVIQAVEKGTGKVLGEQAVADKPGTIQENSGTRIALQAPGGKGFQKGVDYVVTLKNKEGHALWTGSFEIGEAPPPPPAPRGGGKSRRRP